MCDTLAVSPAGYHVVRRRVPSSRASADAALTDQIKAAYQALRGNPGVRRMWAHLVAAGWKIAHKRVHRLMQAAGLQGRHPRAWKQTTVAGEKPVPAPDLIGRNCSLDEPNSSWCGDITDIMT